MATPFFKPRALALLSLLALATTGAVGCAADEADDNAASSQEDGSSRDDITQVKHTKVKRQSIGNCWIYATQSWAEALHRAATNAEVNTSESYLTYWHWFEQLANGQTDDAIETGGFWGTAVDLISRYGMMAEGDFITNEASAEMSNRQKQALDALNASLKTGVLKDPRLRRDRGVVRKELDRVWGLDQAQIARLDTVFGKAVERTIDRSATAKDAAPANKIIRAEDFTIRLFDPQSKAPTNGTLADAIGKSSGFLGTRQGKFAFNEVNYPTGQRQRRDFWKRVQRALHDEIPVVTSWKVDFNALTRDSRFSFEELSRKGPGKQGGHMTVMHDYEADVPGLGLLKAGVPATREQMNAALSDDTQIRFVRVKNSWGGIRPDRWDTAAIMGYHDMEWNYLNGPIKECQDGPDGVTDPTKCFSDIVPLWDVVLPAGY